MSGDHSSTALHNKELLTLNLRVKQIGITQLYDRSDLLVFSPAVALNGNGSYWFDIREVNLEKRRELARPRCILLLRIVPDIFIVCEFSELEKILIKPEPSYGKHKWSFYIEKGFSRIRNKKSDDFIPVSAIDKAAIMEKLASLQIV